MTTTRDPHTHPHDDTAPENEEGGREAVGAGAGAIVSKGRAVYSLAEMARTFVVVNAAIAVAWVKYVQGTTYTTWTPTRR